MATALSFPRLVRYSCDSASGRFSNTSSTLWQRVAFRVVDGFVLLFNDLPYELPRCSSESSEIGSTELFCESKRLRVSRGVPKRKRKQSELQKYLRRARSPRAANNHACAKTIPCPEVPATLSQRYSYLTRLTWAPSGGAKKRVRATAP